MKPEELDPRLDALVRELREEPLDPAAAGAAAHRVWARLADTRLIAGCDGFRARFAAYRAGRLSEGQMLLVKDHLHECVACRKAFAGGAEMVALAPARRAPAWWWAAAAALMLAAGLSAWGGYYWWSARPQGSPVVAQEVRGAVFAWAGSSLTPVAAGQTLTPGADIRTARGGGATLRLRDGSLVEMPERSVVRVTESRRDLTIHLAGGRVLVEAAKDRSRRLYVDTPDCRVAVTGTVFSVNSGVKGSRVAVIEGQVRVAQARTERVLRAGDQFTTSPALARVSVEEEISWSRQVDRHIALLRELTKFRHDLEAIRLPAPRYSSRLLPLVPADTMIYISLPNLADALAEGGRILEQRAASGPALAEWWTNHGQEISKTLAWVGRAGSRLGEEVVIAVRRNSIGNPEVLVLAERRGAVRELFAQQPEGGPVRFVDGLRGATLADQRELLAIERGNLFAASNSPEMLAASLAARDAGVTAAVTPLADELTRVYRDGAGVLIAVDWQRLAQGRKQASAPLRQVNAIVVGESSRSGAPQTRVEITFDPAQPGPASWLAKPGPIPALDYVSASAAFVSAAAVKTPAAIVDEMLKLQPKLAEQLARAGRELGLNLQDDLAAPLGAQFVLAIDGALLPTPSWKLVAEVYDPARLQWALERLVDAARRQAAKEGHPGPSLDSESAGGRVLYRLAAGGKQWTEIHYLYDGGFLLAAPSRALLERALQVRSAGGGLTRAPSFQALLPRDGYANFSAMLYSHLATAVNPLVDTFTAGEALTPEQKQALEQLAADGKPLLVVAYAEAGRIIVATAESLTQLGLSHFFGAQTLLGRPLLKQPGTSRAPDTYR